MKARILPASDPDIALEMTGAEARLLREVTYKTVSIPTLFGAKSIDVYNLLCRIATALDNKETI